MINNFGVEHGVTGSQYFADILSITGHNKNNTFLNLINFNTGKYLKVDELLLILDNAGTHQKILLDYLCSKYNFTCSHIARTQTSSTDNIKDLLLSIGAQSGDIFKSFLEYSQDNDLSSQEIKELIKISYQSRALLNEFESNLKLRLRGYVDDL